jgi:hypothetical protein
MGSGVGGRDLFEEGEFAEDLAGAFGDGAERVFSDVDWEPGFFREEFIETAEESAAAGEDEASVDEVGGEFRGAAFEGDPDGVDDGVERFEEGFADLLGGDGDGFGEACDHVAAFDFHGGFLAEGVGGADADFDIFGGAFPDHEVVGPFHVLGDGFVEFVAGDAD